MSTDERKEYYSWWPNYLPGLELIERYLSIAKTMVILRLETLTTIKGLTIKSRCRQGKILWKPLAK